MRALLACQLVELLCEIAWDIWCWMFYAPIIAGNELNVIGYLNRLCTYDKLGATLTVDPPYASEPSVVRSFNGTQIANKSVRPAYIIPSPRPLNTRNTINPVVSAISKSIIKRINPKFHRTEQKQNKNYKWNFATINPLSRISMNLYLLNMYLVFTKSHNVWRQQRTECGK